MELDVLYLNWNQPSLGGTCNGGICPLSGFSASDYWSSTVEDSMDSWAYSFYYGNQLYNQYAKTALLRARCVRR